MTTDPPSVFQKIKDLTENQYRKQRRAHPHIVGDLQAEIAKLIEDSEDDLNDLAQNVQSNLGKSQQQYLDWSKDTIELRAAQLAHLYSMILDKDHAPLYEKSKNSHAKQVETSKENFTNSIVEFPYTNWTLCIENNSRTIHYALLLELKLIWYTFKERARNDSKWMKSWINDILQDRRSLIGASGGVLVSALIIALLREILYYSHFDFDVTPYIIESFTLSTLVDPIFNVLIVAFIISIFSLFVVIVSAGVGVFLGLTGSTLLKIVQWKSRVNDRFRRLRSSQACLNKKSEQDIAVDPSEKYRKYEGSVRPISWRTHQDMLRKYRYSLMSQSYSYRGVLARICGILFSNRIFRSACLILALLISSVGIWMNDLYNIDRILGGHSNVKIFTSPPIKDPAIFAKLGTFGRNLFIAIPFQITNPSVVHPDSYIDRINIWSRDRLRWLQGRFHDRSVQDKDCSRVADCAFVTVIDLNSVACMGSPDRISETCPTFADTEENDGGTIVLDPTVIQVIDSRLQVIFNNRLQEIRAIREKDDYESSIKSEISRKIQEEYGGCSGEDLYVSEPILFQRDNALIGNDYLENGKNPETLRSALQRFGSRGGSTIYVIGLASPDGDFAHNFDLAERRAMTVVNMISQGDMQEFSVERRVLRKLVVLGEVHFTQGIANSRSVRFSWCEN